MAILCRTPMFTKDNSSGFERRVITINNSPAHSYTFTAWSTKKYKTKNSNNIDLPYIHLRGVEMTGEHVILMI